MNNFTKEELETIWEGLLWRDNHISPKERTNGLQNKIRSMIENFCEHDLRKGIHLFKDIYCTKCNKKFEENNE